MNESIIWPVVAPSMVSETRFIGVRPSRSVGRVGLLLADVWILRPMNETILLSPESARSLGAALLVAADEAEKMRGQE